MKLSAEVFKDKIRYPEKVIQFGEGNFLRAFVDWIIDEMNDRNIFNGSTVVIQPLPNGMINILNNQDGIYTLYLQGMHEGEPVNVHKIIKSVSRALNPYEDYEKFLKAAEGEEIRFVFSNTTEAGIAFDDSDTLNKIPHSSYPAKLTALLYHRFKHFKGDRSRGLIIIPCELIDRNGEKLKKIVLKYADVWNLEAEFTKWIEESNVFCCSLVDRIVPGFPRENIREVWEQLGYEDDLVDVGELFHLWVIEGPAWLNEEFPAASIGLNVKVVEDMSPYRDRKVRILNGFHTAMVPIAYLYGIDTVKEAVDNEVIGKFMKEAVFDEIIPTLNLAPEECIAFAEDVVSRFRNPFIKHNLMSIALNAMSKYDTRVLPSLLEYVNRTGKLPEKLIFSLAAYIEFYKGARGKEKINLQDEPHILELYKNLWSSYDGSYEGLEYIVKEILAYERIWSMDLNQVPDLTKTLVNYLYVIENKGIHEALEEFV